MCQRCPTIDSWENIFHISLSHPFGHKYFEAPLVGTPELVETSYQNGDIDCYWANPNKDSHGHSELVI